MTPDPSPAPLITLGGAVGLVVGLRKVYLMLKTLMQAVATIWLVVVAVELETQGEGKGAEKKAEAQERVKAVLDPLLPDWLNPVVHAAAGMLIDALVKWANNNSFFGELKLGSNA